jgi:hypothetical protein
MLEPVDEFATTTSNGLWAPGPLVPSSSCSSASPESTFPLDTEVMSKFLEDLCSSKNNTDLHKISEDPAWLSASASDRDWMTDELSSSQTSSSLPSYFLE